MKKPSLPASVVEYAVDKLPESWRAAWSANPVVIARQNDSGTIGWFVRLSGADWATDGAAMFRLAHTVEGLSDVRDPPFDFDAVVPCTVKRGAKRSTYGDTRFQVNTGYLDLIEATFPGGTWGKAPAGFGNPKFNGSDVLVWNVDGVLVAAVMPIDTTLEDAT